MTTFKWTFDRLMFLACLALLWLILGMPKIGLDELWQAFSKGDWRKDPEKLKEHAAEFRVPNVTHFARNSFNLRNPDTWKKGDAAQDEDGNWWVFDGILWREKDTGRKPGNTHS